MRWRCGTEEVDGGVDGAKGPRERAARHFCGQPARCQASRDGLRRRPTRRSGNVPPHRARPLRHIVARLTTSRRASMTRARPRHRDEPPGPARRRRRQGQGRTSPRGRSARRRTNRPRPRVPLRCRPGGRPRRPRQHSAPSPAQSASESSRWQRPMRRVVRTRWLRFRRPSRRQHPVASCDSGCSHRFDRDGLEVTGDERVVASRPQADLRVAHGSSPMVGFGERPTRTCSRRISAWPA